MDPVSNATGEPRPSLAVSSKAKASDYETFLQMLTTQLENQDPTDPSDADELAVQLATFSAVEQQTYTNELLNDLIAQTSVRELADLGTWVGKDVLASGPVSFDGVPVELTVSVPALAERAELVVYRGNGGEVQRLPIDTATQKITWAGMGANGAPLPKDTYWFEVEATSAGQPLKSETVSAYREVSEVRIGAENRVLLTSSGDEIDVSDVVALR